MNDEITDRDELSMLAALGEADEPQAARLGAEIAADPAFARAHRERCEGVAQLRELGAQIRDAAPLPQLSESARARLDAARREAFAAVARAEPEAVKHRKVIRPLVWITALAACAVAGLFAVKLLSPGDHPPILTLAPAGETGTTAPTIVWENAAEPDQRYDVWILPEGGDQKDAKALFVAKGVRSPLEFSAMKPASEGTQLSPDSGYQILVCYADAGRLAGTARPFSIAAGADAELPVPASPAAATLAITDLMENGRPSDALMLIERLPAAIRELTEIQSLRRAAIERIPQSP